MRIRWETLDNSWVFGLGIWRDDGLFFGPAPDDFPTDLYFNIYLIVGFIEIRVRLS